VNLPIFAGIGRRLPGLILPPCPIDIELRYTWFMASPAADPWFSFERGAFALGGSPVPVPPSVTIMQVAQFLGALEQSISSPEWREVAPHRIACIRAYIRMGLASLEYVDEGAQAGFWNLNHDLRTTLEETMERAEDLIDTLSWGAEAHEELAKLAEACE
jgi:hypothetical protein